MDSIDWPGIIRLQGPLVWKTAYRLVGNAEDANDCFQETFADAVRQSQRQVVDNWPGFLVQIATRRAIDLLRQRESRQRRQDAWAEQAIRDQAGHDPSTQAADRELVEQLREQLADLPEQHALIFSLRYFQEWSDNEIAEHLGLKSGNVRVLLHRIRERLRQRLTEDDSNSKLRTNP